MSIKGEASEPHWKEASNKQVFYWLWGIFKINFRFETDNILLRMYPLVPHGELNL